MIEMKKLIIILSLTILFPLISFAHCPLCVGGVLVITFLGFELGMKKVVLGLLIGAFSFAFAEWINRLIKKKFFKGQEILIIALTYLPSYLAVKKYIFDYYSIYLIKYGINKLILIDKSLIAGIFGGILVLIAPVLSKWITQKTSKHIPFQRIIVTLILLIIFSLIFQFLI
jgi:hypothetical protein